MRVAHLWASLAIAACFVFTSFANEKANHLLSLYTVGETNQLDASIEELRADKEALNYLVQKVDMWGKDPDSILKAEQALRILVAAKAPEAVDLLLGIRTYWLINGMPSGEETVEQQNHVKALIAIGDPSVQAILSDRYIGSEVIKEGRAYEYAVVIVGVKGADDARAMVAEALTKETRDPQKTNLATLSKMIEQAIGQR